VLEILMMPLKPFNLKLIKSMIIIKPFCKYIIFVALLAGCGESNSIADSEVSKDAIALCQSYSEDNWKDVDRSVSIEEFNAVIGQRVKSELQTDAVKVVVDEINGIDFYREIYPHVKSKMEKLTKGKWDCPALEAFYSLNITKDGSDGASQLKKITITAAGDYLFSGKGISPISENIDDIKSELVVGDKVASKVLVVMEAGTNDQQLEPLFKILADLGIENVSVHSDE